MGYTDSDREYLRLTTHRLNQTDFPDILSEEFYSLSLTQRSNFGAILLPSNNLNHQRSTTAANLYQNRQDALPIPTAESIVGPGQQPEDEIEELLLPDQYASTDGNLPTTEKTPNQEYATKRP